MLRRLGTMIAATCLPLAMAGSAFAQEAVLRPSADEARGHIVEPIEPVRRDGVDPFGRGAVAVVLTVDADGRVTDARPESAGGADTPADDTVAEALANAREARFEPFTRDGVARAAVVTVPVWVLPPERARSRRVPFPAGDGRAAVIRLERTGCFGTCPSYTVEIGGDGRVTYTGEGYVAVEGVRRERIAPEAVEALIERFRQADFFSLDDEYVAGVTDNPTYVVSLTIGGRTKRVIDYVGSETGMPFSVVRLEQAIDRAAGTQAWIDGDATTARRLEAGGYDFTSAAAGRALTWMAWEGSEDAALEFVARGAPLIADNGDEGFGARRSALEGAAFHGRSRLVRALIERGALARPGAAESALAAAARSRDAAVLDIVLDAATFDRRQLGRALTAALNEAAWSDPERDPGPVVERLLALDADVTVPDGEGRTPLHGAATPEMVRRLLAMGADIEARTEYGDTPVTSAFDEDVILALIDAGADVTVQPDYSAGVRETAEEYHLTRVLERLNRGR